jgi:undecaprenyl phosphate-alpha-L-ara4N flippase subunit ArnE
MQSNLLWSAVFVLCTVFANVMQKKAVQSLGGMPISMAFVRGLLLSPHLWAGMVSYAVALGSYLVLLTRVPLNVATSIAALNFVAVLVAARVVFGEPIPALRYAGFALILFGIWLVSLTQRAAR